jgi:hypothetical protein
MPIALRFGAAGEPGLAAELRADDGADAVRQLSLRTTPSSTK